MMILICDMPIQGIFLVCFVMVGFKFIFFEALSVGNFLMPKPNVDSSKYNLHFLQPLTYYKL